MTNAAPMSTSLFEFITLRYGKPTSLFCGVTSVTSAGDIAVARPGVRVGRGHLAEARPQLGDSREVIVR